MVIIYHKNFIKQSKSLPSKVKLKLAERLRLFGQDQLDPVLNNHPLKGTYLGFRSINITGDLRAIYQKIDDTVTFVEIGSHSNLYG